MDESLPRSLKDVITNNDEIRFSELSRKWESNPPTEEEFFRGIGVYDKKSQQSLPGGAQAEVFIFRSLDTGDQYVCKDIGAGKGLNRQQAQLLLDETAAYQHELEEIGINLPDRQASCVISPGVEPGEWKIGFVETYVGDGQDIKKIFQDPNKSFEDKISVLEKLADTVDSIPFGEPPRGKHQTQVAGDFRPANFVLDGDSPVLIDSFGPKRYQDNGLVGPYMQEMEGPLTNEAITFLTADKRGQMSALLYFAGRHVRKDPELANAFNAAMVGVANRIQDLDTRKYVLNEINTGFQSTSAIYETGKIDHLPTDVQKENSVQADTERTPLPDPSMHDPEQVSKFVEGYLTEKGETPREVTLQMIGVKTLQNPELIDRFLDDYDKQKEETLYKGKVGLFLIDDSWDDDAADNIRQIALDHNVEYYRVREDSGFADTIIQKMADRLQESTDLTEAQKKYQFWLARGLLKDRLQAPLSNDLENFTFTNPLAELGGDCWNSKFWIFGVCVRSRETWNSIARDDRYHK